MAVDVTEVPRTDSEAGSAPPDAPWPNDVIAPDPVPPPAPPDTDWRPALVGGHRGRGARRALRVMGAGLTLGVLAGVAWAGVELSGYRDGLDGRLLPGVVVEGVDLSGMGRDQAVAAVEAALAPELERPVTMWWADQTWTTTPADVGSTSDAAAVVDRAVAAGADPSWAALARMRFLDEGLGFEGDAAVTHSPGGARAWVAEVGASIERVPRDAAADHSSGWVEFTAAESGLTPLVDATAGNLARTIATGGDTVRLGVVETPPAVTAVSMEQILLVRQDENRLYLYQDGEITHDWVVTTGSSGHPTPTGEFTISVKRHMPSWYNPAPDGWGADLPESIGPGPGNPLGVRALNWVDADGNDDGIRFHGTDDLGALGGPGSKGCVRLANDEVVELYDLVDVGARVISVD